MDIYVYYTIMKSGFKLYCKKYIAFMPLKKAVAGLLWTKIFGFSNLNFDAIFFLNYKTLNSIKLCIFLCN